MRPKGSAQKLERRRRQAIALLNQGMKPAEVARVVGRSRASVTRWRQAYEAGGEKALASRPHPGGKSRLTVAQRKGLARLLRQGPRKHGYNTKVWTLKRVAEVIAAQFDIKYHPSAVWHILRALGWSYWKPERWAQARGEEAMSGWRREK